MSDKSKSENSSPDIDEILQNMDALPPAPRGEDGRKGPRRDQIGKKRIGG
jgi:hypothetical protein